MGSEIYRGPLEISVAQWRDLLSDGTVTPNEAIEVLRIVRESGDYGIAASEIASKLRLIPMKDGRPNHVAITGRVVRFAKRVIESTGAQLPQSHDRVPFWGYGAKGKWLWLMRPELAEAFENVFKSPGSELVYSGEFADASSLPEGALSRVYVNRYERNRRAREACIARLGTRCVVCNFEFEETYGAMGKGQIHVHHRIPLSEIQEAYEVDPVVDLVPVCPNCHFMIHSRKQPYTVEEMRARLRMRFRDFRGSAP